MVINGINVINVINVIYVIYVINVINCHLVSRHLLMDVHHTFRSEHRCCVAASLQSTLLNPTRHELFFLFTLFFSSPLFSSFSTLMHHYLSLVHFHQHS